MIVAQCSIAIPKSKSATQQKVHSSIADDNIKEIKSTIKLTV